MLQLYTLCYFVGLKGPKLFARPTLVSDNYRRQSCICLVFWYYSILKWIVFQSLTKVPFNILPHELTKAANNTFNLLYYEVTYFELSYLRQNWWNCRFCINLSPAQRRMMDGWARYLISIFAVLVSEVQSNASCSRGAIELFTLL